MCTGRYQFTPDAPALPKAADFSGCVPAKPLTEADVRRIVREELERAGRKSLPPACPFCFSNISEAGQLLHTNDCPQMLMAKR